MRVFAALAASLLLLSGQPGSPSGCPPLTPEQQHRAEVAATWKGSDTPIVGLSTVQLKSYCGLKAQYVVCVGHKGEALPLATVVAVDARLRAQFTYLDDYVQYGAGDHWKASVCGDCEDYSLALAERLAAAGADGSTLRMVMWEFSPGEGHATLLVDTADAGTIEVGNGPAETQGPQPYRPERGPRFATIRFDGKQQFVPEPGYVLRNGGVFRR